MQHIISQDGKKNDLYYHTAVHTFLLNSTKRPASCRISQLMSSSHPNSPSPPLPTPSPSPSQKRESDRLPTPPGSPNHHPRRPSRFALEDPEFSKAAAADANVSIEICGVKPTCCRLCQWLQSREGERPLAGVLCVHQLELLLHQLNLQKKKTQRTEQQRQQRKAAGGEAGHRCTVVTPPNPSP